MRFELFPGTLEAVLPEMKVLDEHGTPKFISLLAEPSVSFVLDLCSLGCLPSFPGSAALAHLDLGHRLESITKRPELKNIQSQNAVTLPPKEKQGIFSLNLRENIGLRAHHAEL